jgi:hypothetical protein
VRLSVFGSWKGYATALMTWHVAVTIGDSTVGFEQMSRRDSKVPRE